MHISEINIYPIKSLKGIRLASALVEKRGLQNDRRWMLTAPDGKFLTQREHSQMALIDVGIDDNGLFVTADRFGTIELPLTPDTAEKRQVEVWESMCRAEIYSAVTNEWFSDVLGMACQLVFMPDDTKRSVNKRFNSGDDIVSFADGYPLLAIGEASLVDLNSRIDASQKAAGEASAFRPLPMNRFRPNIVVSGSAPYDEDNWEKISVNSSIFRATKPCARCVVTTIDQAAGAIAGKEPLKTLSRYRQAKDVIPDRLERLGMSASAVLFGQNLVVENSGNVISVGDTVRIVS